MDKMKVGIVGCGVISDVYLQSIRDNFSILDVTACSDLDTSKMEKTATKYGLKAMPYEDMIHDKDIEMILNLTSPAAHFTLSKAAMEAGKHVYSEKTMAVSFEDGKKLCEIAKANDVRFGSAPDTFLGGGIQTARYVLDKNMIGKVQSGVISLSRDYGVFGENLPHLFTKGGSILYDMSVYYFTAACFLLGNVNRVFAFGKKSGNTHRITRIDSTFFGRTVDIECEDIIGGLLEFESGQIITVHFNSASIVNETYCMEFFGDKGILRMGDPNTYGGEIELLKIQSAPIKFPFTHGFTTQSRGIGAAEIAWSLRAGRPHRTSMEMALHVLEIINGLFECMKTGAPYIMTTKFIRPEILPEGFIGKGFWAPNEETALL